MNPQTLRKARRPLLDLHHHARSITTSRTLLSAPQPETQQARSQSTVDPTEVSHFGALASSWWDPHGSSRLLHLMNPLRQTFIRSCLMSGAHPHPSVLPSAGPPKRTLRYLDVGCGGGIFAESAARLRTTLSVTAIDPTPEVLAIAEAHKRRDPALMEEGRLTYLNIAIEDLPLPATTGGGKPESMASTTIATATSQGTPTPLYPVVETPSPPTSASTSTSNTALTPPHAGYDVVTLFEVLEHVASPSHFLSTLLPHVAPGGWLVLSTIARTWTSWATTIVAAEDILGIVPRGTHDWSKYVNEAEVRAWFAAQPGWEAPRCMGVVYVPGIGWQEVKGGEAWGNYFFAIRRSEAKST